MTKDRRRKHLKPPWKPGQSGNPGGRPKAAFEVKDWLRDKLTDPKNLEDVWKRAQKSDYVLRMVFEYALGKPPQPVTGEGGGPLEVIVKYADR